MSKGSLVLVALALGAIAAARFTSSTTVRAQGPTGLEYLRMTPYVTVTPVAANAVQESRGYRACAAGTAEWRCRDFQSPKSSAEALRTALVTLGNEGWELVSAVEEDPAFNTRGLTYLFKRPAR